MSTDTKPKEINTYLSLNLGNSWENKPESHMKAFARGWWHGARGERWDAMQWRAHQARTQTDVHINEQVDVRVYWDNEPHDFTFDEFQAWADTATEVEGGQLQP